MMRSRYQILLFVFMSLHVAAWAQQPDTSAVLLLDSLPHSDKKEKLKLVMSEDSFVVAESYKTPWMRRVFTKNYPNPRLAALLSVFPGGGQAYNKKWWKIPIIYGALGAMGWWAVTTDQQYKKLRDNYKWVVDGDPDTAPFEAPYTFMSASQLKGYRDLYRNYTEKRYLWLGITYLLSITDAFVDAHLSRFDISDDLSLRLKPVILPGPQGPSPILGLGVQVGLGRP